MVNAEVGDDVFGDDPTVNRLQEVVAELLGKEAALFVPSGTMGNQLALGISTRPGDQVALDKNEELREVLIQAVPVKVRFSAFPGAEIILDGNLIGRVPPILDQEIAPGFHTIVFINTDLDKRHEEKVELKAETNIKLHMKMDTGELLISKFD